MQDAKDLVFVDSLRNLFALMLEKKNLTQRTVSLVSLNEDSIQRYSDSSDSVLIFIIEPEEKYFEFISRFLLSLKQKEIFKKCSMIIYPQRTPLCNFYLEKYKLKPDFINSIHSLNFGLIPLGTDILSLESPSSLKQMFIGKEFDHINESTKAIEKLQLIYGRAPCIYAKGDYATEAVRLMKRNEKNSKVLDKHLKGK